MNRPHASRASSLVGWLAAGLSLLLLLGGCAAPQGQAILLPDRNGASTALEVTQGDKSLRLARPYDGANLTSAGPRAFTATEQQARERYGAALGALPEPPVRFTLYFVEGRDEFTEESRRLIDSVFKEIARRPVPDVVVVGHTDTVGTPVFNDTLSRQRAEVARAALVARGLAPEQIVAIGRGKREPIVPTADGVAEARNRRVEILVR